MRDGSAHVLRCLKVWYDLPSDVFHTALANIDTFLAKMKVNILMTFYTFMLPSLQYKSLNHQGHLQPCLLAFYTQFDFVFPLAKLFV